MSGKEAVVEMFNAFGNTDNKRMAVYIKHLSQFPAPLIVKACQKAMYEQKYNVVPTLAELIASIKSLLGEARPDTRVKPWSEAWDEINSLMYKYGCTGKEVVGSTTEITQTIKAIGGIDVLAKCPANDFNTLRAQVRRMYEDTCKRASEKQINGYILGKSNNLLQSEIKRIGAINGRV